MTVDQVIRDGDTLVSAREIYQLGFFSPGSSKNRFLGIWYKNISPQTVVWVANRETPITDSSGVFTLATNGSLLVISGSNHTVVWSSNTSLVSPRTINPVAQLLDMGNLVVRRNGEESFIWQSFDYPGDTFLPGMKFGKDLVSGLDRRYRSWKSLDDPSPGEFVGFMDTNGFPQMIEEKGSIPLMRYGPWNGNSFNGLPYHQPNAPFKHEFVFNDKEVYYMYNIVNTNSFMSRIYVNPEGDFYRLTWVEQQWKPYWQAKPDMQCFAYGLCGPNGMCNANNAPACRCMQGFEPRNPDEWSASEWSRGCRRLTPLDCPTKDGFQEFKNIKLPDTRRSWYNMNMTLSECANVCKNNCSCTAYSNIYITNGGSGCLLWFGDLVDVGTVLQSQSLYVRMAQSDITTPVQEPTSKPSSNKKRGITVVLLSILSCLVMVIVILAVVYPWSKKRRYIVKKPGRL